MRFTSIITGVSLLLLPAAANAHTALTSSSPAKGAVVTSFTELRVRFSERVEPNYTSVKVVGPDGVAVAMGPLTPVDTSRNREFVALSRSAVTRPGVYTVTWRAAGKDGHPATGSFTFSVAEPARPSVDSLQRAIPVEPPIPSHADTMTVHAAESTTPSSSPVAVAVRWLNFIALLGLIGAVTFRLFILPRALAGPGTVQMLTAAEHHVWRFAAVATLVAVIALVARLILQSVAMHGAQNAFDGDHLRMMITSTRWGQAWLLQLVATVAVIVTLLVSRNARETRHAWIVSAAAVATLAVVPALSGHASAVDRFGAIAILSDIVHVTAAGLWLGTLAALITCGLPATSHAGAGQPDPRIHAVAQLVDTFSRLAVVAVAVVILTGVTNAVLHLHALADLTSTAYGRTLFIKVATLLVVLGTGFYNWRYVRPSLATAESTGRIVRSASIEITAGILVIAITAILVALPTP
ncbi:MAG: copper resistance protein CopC [Longimicrobiales bacterium]